MSIPNETPPVRAPAPTSVAAFVRHVAELWDEHLGERLAGIYLIGSLAHGGYSARYSDIDIVLIATEGVDGGDIAHVAGKAAGKWPILASALSLFWADEGFSKGRFPPLDRIDYLDYGQPLLQRRRLLPQRPTLAEVRSYLSGEPFGKWSRQVARFIALDALAAADHKSFLRTLLYPARFLYSWETGGVASNEDAVAYVESRGLAGPDADLIARALRCREAGDDPLPLFPERQNLLRLVDVCSDRVAAIQAP